MIAQLYKQLKRVIVASLLCPFFSIYSFAADVKQADIAEPVSVTSALQMILGLLFVVGFIFAISFFLKRISGFSVYSNQHMKVLSGLHVGQKEKILLLQISDKQIVVGVTPYSIRKLHELEENIVVDTSLEKVGNFSDKLMQAIKREYNKK